MYTLFGNTYYIAQMKVHVKSLTLTKHKTFPYNDI